MSTIHCPVAPMHNWWYVAAAVLAGAVLSLLIAVLQTSTPSPHSGSTWPGSGGLTQHFAPAPKLCFAGRIGAAIELTRSFCPVARP